MCERTIVSDEIIETQNEYFAIEKRIEEMIVYLNIMVRHFPKTEKYILAGRVRDLGYEIYELAITVNKRFYKKTTVSELNVKHESLRRMVHLAYKLGYIDSQKFRVAQKHISEVGKMLGAWIKTIVQ